MCSFISLLQCLIGLLDDLLELLSSCVVTKSLQYKFEIETTTMYTVLNLLVCIDFNVIVMDIGRVMLVCSVMLGHSLVISMMALLSRST